MQTDRTIFHFGRPAGFWIRSCANVLDLILVVLLVMAAARLGTHVGFYIPIEVSVLVLLATYFVATETLTRQTIGKWVCGLAVTSINNQTPRTGQLLVRETGKAMWVVLFAEVFLLGAFNRRLAGIALLIWLSLSAGLIIGCGFSRSKRAWHDRMAVTVVIRKPPRFGQWSIWVAVLCVGLALAWWLGLPGWIRLACDSHKLGIANAEKFAFENRDPNKVVEVTTLREDKRGTYVDWLKTNAMSPMEYVVAKARLHPVLVFGEEHETKDYLDLFNELIPRLYHEAGVTTVAMEVCLSEDNPELERLVTGKTFDRDLAVKLARHGGWGIWGWREYWNVFETIWRLNQTIPAGRKKVRLIGLDSFMDVRSFAMTISEDQASLRKYLPSWERLRLLRLLPIFPKLVGRDLRMAAQSERQIFDKSEHAVIWVGQEHAHACPRIASNGSRDVRMGAMLRQRHGDAVFFIWLHCGQSAMPRIIETLVSEGALVQAGFDISGSPLGFLKEAADSDYEFEPRLAFMDMTDGYIFLKPEKSLAHCTWVPGYITPEMFTAGKPFYQAWGRRASHPINSAAEANAFFGDPKNYPTQ